LQVQLFAGHDTSVSALTNLCLNLSRHPAVEDRLRQELAALPAVPSPEALEALPQLNAVIHEGLRHASPVAGAFRTALTDIAYEGHRIPKGWTIAVSIAGTHQAAWSEPERFDPDRFLAGRPDPFGFVPFGGGPRLCLGRELALLEMRIVLSRLYRLPRWTLEPNQDLTVTALPFPRPKSGLDVRFLPPDAREPT
jgi:cytochrome P450